MFADESLNDLEARALSANQNLKKAVARVDESRANLRVAQSARYPAINLNQSYERNRVLENGSVSSEQDQFRTTIDGSYELDLWVKFVAQWNRQPRNLPRSRPRVTPYYST